MVQRGRRRAAHHARLAAAADIALDADFPTLSDGIIEWLDNGNYEAFEGALATLEQEYFPEVEPVEPSAPRDSRIAVLAGRYSEATKALANIRLITELIQGQRDIALAELITTAAEPASMPVYWQKLVRRIQAEGIRQTDVHPSSIAMAKHLAAALRDFNAADSAEADESYGDLPIGSWAELPRDFAGFTLIDFDKSDMALRPDPCPLPPSTDIAYYTADGHRPNLLYSRHATYTAWIKIIVAWCDRTGRKLDQQHQAIWAMLLAYKIKDDVSKVDFFKGRLIESPWQRDQIVIIEIVEDQIPSHLGGP